MSTLKFLLIKTDIMLNGNDGQRIAYMMHFLERYPSNTANKLFPLPVEKWYSNLFLLHVDPIFICWNNYLLIYWNVRLLHNYKYYFWIFENM